MKKIISILIIALIFELISPEEYTTFPFTKEAEDCEGVSETLTSVWGTEIKGTYSGEGFIYLEETPFSFTVTVPEDDMFQFNAKLAQLYDDNGKLQTISINGIDTSFTVPKLDTWTDFDFGIHRLNKGLNTITFKKGWGYVYYDSITIQKATFPDLTSMNVTLSDPKATSEAKKIQKLLGKLYGRKIISAQQETYYTDGNYEVDFEYIKTVTGKSPAIRGFDFMNYNPLFWWDDKTTERIIDWVKEKGGIATASWHINIPKDFESYNIGDTLNPNDCTYDQTSNFKTEDCIVEGTKEKQFWDLAIKSLADQLKRLQDENIPIIFRPLHEAEGNGGVDGSQAWFWWGKKGAEIYVKIWKYLYTKLTQEYELHNLIWEQNLYTWTSESDQWYAGDEWVDLIGYDKYNFEFHRNDGKTGVPNLDAESNIFYTLVKYTKNKKMVCMAENDSIPSLENLKAEKAFWLYFNPWFGDYLMDEKYNTKENLKEIYTSDYCVTLADLPSLFNEIDKEDEDEDEEEDEKNENKNEDEKNKNDDENDNEKENEGDDENEKENENENENKNENENENENKNENENEIINFGSSFNKRYFIRAFLLIFIFF